MNTTNTTIFEISKHPRLYIFACICFVMTVPSWVEAATCDFTRSLYIGVAPGSDIKCLQEYLNESGYVVSPNGVGARGRETMMYADKTRSAVLRWQLDHDVAGANGVFGPASRARYEQLVDHTNDTNATSNQSNDSHDDASVEATSPRIEAGSQISDVITDALEEVQSAQELIDDSSHVSPEVQKHMDKAMDALFDMLFAAFKNEDSTALIKAVIAINQSNEVGSALRLSQQNEVQVNNDAKNKAWDIINDTEEDITKAQDKLDRAEDMLRDAQDEYTDANWEHATKQAQEARMLVRKIGEEL